MDAEDQAALDARLRELDGTDNKRRLGANALLGVSLAVARAAAVSERVPLYRYLGGSRAAELPVPMINIASGGLHGGGNIDFQDFQVIPLRAERYSQALHDVVLIYVAMKDVLKARGVYSAGVADEGGYAPRLASNEAGFEVMVEAMERAGFEPGKDAAIAVDVAASHFYKNGHYQLSTEREEWSSRDLVERLATWTERYPILSIEDGVAEDDEVGWKLLTEKLGQRCQLIGDDNFVTNPRRLEEGIRHGIANAVLVKMNQIGTLSETLEVIKIAQRAGYRTVVSARSGETEDDSMSDLAVATGAGQLKVGAITRSERLAKYNRLLRIEESLGKSAIYRGVDIFRGFEAAPVIT
jgi:enolase